MTREGLATVVVAQANGLDEPTDTPISDKNELTR